jgi:hypothetical protein
VSRLSSDVIKGSSSHDCVPLLGRRIGWEVDLAAERGQPEK